MSAMHDSSVRINDRISSFGQPLGVSFPLFTRIAAV